MIKTCVTIVLYSMIAAMIFSCASDYKRGPAGGLDDRLAPRIAATYPLNGALNQKRNIHAEIEFDEFIKFSSTKKALSISPLTAAANSSVVWGEKSVDISFKDLEDNTTVLIIVNTSLQDMHGNGLADNMILTFSTGAVIDSTSYSGTAAFAVKDDELKSLNQQLVKVSLYKYEDVMDSGLVKSQPVYRAGVNKTYDFSLPHLKRDHYFPLVFEDRNGNNKLDVDAGELFSFGRGPVDLRTMDSYHETYVCSAADTIPPIIKDITEENIDLLKVEFTEPVSAATTIIDSVVMNKKNIFKYECRKQGADQYLYAAVDTLIENAELTLYTSDFHDSFDNTVMPRMKKRTVITAGEVLHDSLKLTGRIPTRMAVDDTLTVTHNKPAALLNFTFSSNGKDSLEYTAGEEVVTQSFASKIPLADTGLKTGSYKFLIRSAQDTLYYNNFVVGKAQGFGSISGSVSPPADDIVLLFTNIDGSKKRDASRKITLAGKQTFKTSVRPGSYLVASYHDRDQNGRYSGGDIRSTEDLFAEKVTVYADTVVVRKNWESSGIHINLDQ